MCRVPTNPGTKSAFTISIIDCPTGLRWPWSRQLKRIRLVRSLTSCWRPQTGPRFVLPPPKSLRSSPSAQAGTRPRSSRLRILRFPFLTTDDEDVALRPRESGRVLQTQRVEGLGARVASTRSPHQAPPPRASRNETFRRPPLPTHREVGAALLSLPGVREVRTAAGGG